MNLRHLIIAGAVALAPISAHAAVIDYTITADNAFAIYISNNDATLGTLVSTNLGGPAGQWSQTFSGSIDVSGTEYIQIVGFNYTSSNGLWTTPGTPGGTGDNPDALLGSFTISGGTFANGTTSLVTGINGWLGIAVPPSSPDTPSAGPPSDPGWLEPLYAVQSYGANGVSPWGTISGIPSDADWIWSVPDNGAYADFSTLVTATPLPAALPLFAAGIATMCVFGWRRKRGFGTPFQA